VKVFVGSLATVFLTLAAPVAAQTSAPPVEVPYQFALAKLLAQEGELQEALAAFEQAERLAPDSPYVLVEYAQQLARSAQIARTPEARTGALRLASEKVEKARRLAPESPDVLRTAGAVYLDLAEHDPAALAKARQAFEVVYRSQQADSQIMLVLGRLYLDQGEADEAVEVFRELGRVIPQNRTVQAFLTEALLRAKKTEEAEKALADLLALAPDSLEARMTLAEMQGERGDHRAAADTLLGAPEAVRQDVRLRRQLAWSLYLAGDLETTLQTVEPLLKADPNDRHLALLKGLALAAEGRNGEAVRLLEQVRAAQPEDRALAQTLARVLERDGQMDEASRVLADAAGRLEKAGKAEEAQVLRLELAELYADAGRWDEAGAALDPLLRSGGPAVRSQALLLRVDTLIEAERFDEALALLDRAGASPVVTSKRAEVLSRAGREAEATAQLSGLVASDDPQQVLTAVQVYQRLEKYEPSIPLLQKLVERHPDNLTARFLLGTAYERTGRHEQAVEQLRRVLALEPDFHAALNYLGYIYAERGENLEEALALVRRAVSLEPDNGAYVDSLGWAYYRLGRFEQARGYLERATRLDPGDATLHEHLGDVYVALGQTEKAREVYRRALELGDDNAEQVRRKLDSLPDSSATPRR
jgi:tetratricopeptide (TPR) repeat protein